MSNPLEVSAREAEVLAALGAHLSNAQIARKLHISVRTVESHVSSLLRKFGVADRRALAGLAGTTPEAGPRRLAGLPSARTSFIGRSRERDEILAAFTDHRLVTLVGPGGAGKTRLAAVVAEAAAPSYRHAGAFVDLVPVRDGFVTQTVAAGLGVTESPRQPLDEAIAERLGRDRALLVLDNCEHLVDPVAAFVDRLLTACPAAHVLVTSRERLGVPGERIVTLGPLPLGSDAEMLFLDRARAADPEFVADQATIGEICTRLDGMPLAVELAAARSAALGASGVLCALDDHLRLLVGGRGEDERHRSLRGVLGWSHDLLGEEEQRLFRYLAVFVAGFDLDAVVAIAGGTQARAADVLGRLVDKSMVARMPGERGRWRLLETVRAFAAEQLAAGADAAEVRERYLRWAAVAGGELERRLDGDWQDAFDAVADDLRAALAGAAPGPAELPHRLARTLGRLTYARRFLAESLGHYREAASRAPSPAEAARDLRSAADCCHAVLTAGDQAFELLLEAIDRARAAGDPRLLAIAVSAAVITSIRRLGDSPATASDGRLRDLLTEATAASGTDDPVVAAWLAVATAWSAASEPYHVNPTLAEAAVTAARAAGDPVLVSSALEVVITMAIGAGEFRKAHRICGERLALLDLIPRHEPSSAPEIVDAFHVASRSAVAAGDLPAAIEMGARTLDDDLIGGQSYLWRSNLVLPLALSGEFDDALAHATAAWESAERTEAPVTGAMVPFLIAAALVHGLRGDEPRHRMWRARVPPAAGEPFDHSALVAFLDARVALHLEDYDRAETLVDQVFSDISVSFYRSHARAAAAELAAAAGLADAESRLTAVDGTESRWAQACLARARGRLGDRAALERSLGLWERIGARFERAATLLLRPGREAEGYAELDAIR